MRVGPLFPTTSITTFFTMSPALLEDVAPSVDPNATCVGLPSLAIIGMSLRFPQDAVSPKAFWDMLVERRCASTDFPADRINISAWHSPDKSRLDSLSMRGGHF